MACFCKGKKSGFSMIEVIIVMAILGILVGSSVAVVSHINNGNSKKSAANLSATLSKMRMDSMTKNNKKYMYLYQKNDGIYMSVIIDPMYPDGYDDWTTLQGKIDPDDETKLGNDRLKFRVSGKNDAGNISERDLGIGNIIKISYDHEKGNFSRCNGGHDLNPSTFDGTFYDTIKICMDNTENTKQYEIKLVEQTGKHILR